MKVGFDQTSGLSEIINLLREKLGQDTPRFKEAEKLVTTTDQRNSSFNWDVIHEVWEKYLPEYGDLSSEFATGDLIGDRYRIVDWPHQRGGMGTVVKALDSQLSDRPVALKFFPQYYSQLPNLVENIKKEVDAHSKLRHPNIVDIKGFDKQEGGEAGGRYYIALEFVEGENLRERLSRGPKLTIPQIIDIAKEIAQGIDAIHKAGFIHCDLKPENILIAKDSGNVKIIDFGVSILAHGPSSVGRGKTLAYSSPEQVKKEELGSWSDIWSLGVILYELITGKRPFGGSGEELEKSILIAKYEPIRKLQPKCPKKFQKLIERCLARNPADRYQNFYQLSRVLRDLKKSRFHKFAPLVLSVAIIGIVLLLFSLVTYQTKSAVAEIRAIQAETELAEIKTRLTRDNGKNNTPVNCPGEAPDYPIFNIDPLTFRDKDTQICSDFPLIDVALDTTNPQFSTSLEDLHSVRTYKAGQQFVVMLYMHNGAANNLDSSQTTAKNVKIKTAILNAPKALTTSVGILKGKKLHELNAQFSGDNVDTKGGSVYVLLNDDEELVLVENSGYVYNYEGKIILDMQNVNIGNSVFVLGDLDSGWEYSLWFSYKIKVTKKKFAAEKI